MPIPVHCPSCAAYLEIDEAFAGKEIACPDCDAVLRVPSQDLLPARTSPWAVAGLTLSIVGFLTLIGGVVGALLGLIAYRQVKKSGRRVRGRRLAQAAVVLGVVGTVSSAVLFFSPHLPWIDPLLRHSRWLGRLEYPRELTLEDKDAGYAISRPNQDWGVAGRDFPYSHDYENNPRPALLVHPGKGLYVFVIPEIMQVDADFEACEERVRQLLEKIDLAGGRIVRYPNRRIFTDFSPYKRKRKLFRNATPPYLELMADRSYHGQTRTYILRIIRQPSDYYAYVIAGGTDKDRFEAHRDEIRAVLDTFRTVQRRFHDDGQGNFPFRR